MEVRGSVLYSAPSLLHGSIILHWFFFDVPETDAFMLEKAGLINYTHGHYYTQGEPLGRFGFSVMKKKKNH